MKKLIIYRLVLLAMLLTSMFSGIHSQVTIGDGVAPQSFSLLEISSNNTKGGLRLPRITEIQRDEIIVKIGNIADPAIKANAEQAVKGLTIYNLDNNCLESWNGTKWLSFCGGGEVPTSECATITSVTPSANSQRTIQTGSTTTLGAVTATASSGNPTYTYQWYSNTVNSNVGGTPLPAETNSSLTVTGAVAGTFYYFCEVTIQATGTCASTSKRSSVYTIVVNDIDLNTIPTGQGTFLGQTCFDVAEVNNGGSCGSLEARRQKKADFTSSSTNPQTYTFTTSGAPVSKIRFYYTNVNGNVVEEVTPNNPDPANGTNLMGSFSVNVKFFSDLNQTASGLTRANALKAKLYVVYNNNYNGTGQDMKLELTLSVQDCICCPGYLAKGGGYYYNPNSTFSPGSSNVTFSQLFPSFTATGRDVCFYYRDISEKYTTWKKASPDYYCGDDVDQDHKYIGVTWRLPNLAELGAIQSVYNRLSTDPNSAVGTNNIGYTTPSGQHSAYWSKTKETNPQQAVTTGLAWSWDFTIGQGRRMGMEQTPGLYVRCVADF